LEIKELAIDQIRPNPNQPRKFLDESKLKELADSIKSRGLLEEILVRPKDEGFEIVHGERRWRACKLLNWEKIRSKIEPLSDEEAFELSLTENIQRENLLPIEEAKAYKQLSNRGLTHEEIAKKVSKSRTYVTQKLRILKLPFQVQLLLELGELSEGHIRQLLRLEDIIGRHENLDKVKPVWRDLLNIGDYPFTSWVGYYQDYFAWHETKFLKLSVADLKERIDKLYHDILSAIIVSSHKELTPEQEEKAWRAHQKGSRGEALTRGEKWLVCTWFEKILTEKMGLSNKTLAEKDFHFFNEYCVKHGLWEDWSNSEE